MNECILIKGVNRDEIKSGPTKQKAYNVHDKEIGDKAEVEGGRDSGTLGVFTFD